MDVVRGRGGGPYACPCCGYLTLPQRGGYDVCPVCRWEDDGQDEHDASLPSESRGGPNRGLTLLQARENFRILGASSEQRAIHAREPLPHEHPLAR
jgi:hypothetical protein